MLKPLLLALGASTVVAIAAGCTVQTRPAVIDGYAVVGADRVPDDYDRYPHTRYRDRDAYFIDDHWYYRTDGGWVRFEQEPEPLYRWRASAQVTTGGGGYVQQPNNTNGGGYGGGPPVVQQAPPAYGGGGGVYPPPPPRR